MNLSEVTAESPSYDIFEKYRDFHVNEPIGPVNTDSAIPFQIKRTHKGNLPVYTDFKQGG